MIIVLGTTTVDLLLSGLERMPVPEGDEFTYDSFAFCRDPLNMVLGGNGANAAYVLARLGASPALCSAIGQDPLGTIAQEWLDEAGVQTDHLIRSATDATATTVVIADAQRNRQSYHHAGATATFTIDDFPAGYFERADVLLVTGYQLLKGWRIDGMAQALRQARRAGAVTLLDIGPTIDDPPTPEELSALLPDVDYLLANAYELGVCTHADTTREAVDQVLHAGAQRVIVKQGAEGATVWQTDRPEANVPGFEVEAHSTVGAGDAFNAGLIHGLQAGRAVTQAVRWANATAALVVASPEGVLGAPDPVAVDQLMQRASTA
jgi:sugar/nucleoside kinase (ribokinase family)